MIVALALALALALAPPSEAGPPADEGGEPEVAAAETKSEHHSPAYAEVLQPLPEEQRDQAVGKQLSDSGKAAWEDERYDEAIEFFAESYRTFPRAILLYALGGAHRRAYEVGGDVEQRRLAIRRYQQYVSIDPNTEFAGYARNHMTALLAERDLGDLELEVVTRILISTSAEDASVSVDGGPPQSAPGVVRVAPGAHEVVVHAPGYAELARRVDVPEGTTYQVQADLEGLPGTVVVEGSKRAWVRLDGRVVGRLPLGEVLTLEPGPHVVVVTRNGHKAFSQDIEVERDGWQTVRAELDVSARRITSYFLMGLGSGAAIASSVLTGYAYDRQGKAQVLAEAREAEFLIAEQYQIYVDLVEQRNAFRGGAVLSGLAGGALMAAAAVLFAYDPPRIGGRTVASVVPALGPTQLGLSASLSF